MHKQITLIAAGLDFVARAKIGRETPIFSTLPPMRFASLVAGPVSALLSGAALHFDGPFDAAAFFKACERAGHAHLIAPALFGQDFVQTGATRTLRASMSRLTNAIKQFRGPARSAHKRLPVD